MRLVLFKGMAAVMAVLVLSAFTALAADDSLYNSTKSSDVFRLGEIEVSAGGMDTSPPTVERISDETMRKFNRNDLAEAVDLTPGVTLNYGGNRNEMMVNVRGFDLKHVPIYIDGIPVYVPYDGYPDLGRFTTYDLSQINISKGFTSVLYGPNTMGGAINMITRRPTKELDVSGGVGGALDEYHTYLNLGTNQGLWYIQASGSYLDSSGYHLSDSYDGDGSEDGGKRDNSYHKDSKASLKIGLTPNETDEYALSYINQHGEKGTPPYAGTDSSVKTRYWQWPYWDKESLYFNSNTSILDESYVKTRLYYDTFKNKLKSYDDDSYSTQSKKSSFTSLYDDYSYGGSLELGTRLVPNNLVKLAFHYKGDFHEEHNEGDPTQHFEEQTLSVGLEDTLDLTDDIYVIMGASYDHIRTIKAEDNINGVIEDFPDLGSTHGFNPQLGLFYRVGEEGLAHASVAMKTRLPSMKDKYSYKNGKALPNPDLNAEKSINYELGYEHTLLDNWKLEGTLFYNDVDDYILAVTVPDPDDSSSTLEQNQNIGKVKIYGVELGASGAILDNLNAGLNYTYLEYDNETNDEKLTNTPKHKIFAYVEYLPLERLSLMTTAQYEASRFSDSDGSRETDSFTLVGVRMGCQITEHLKWDVGVSNLFDEDYEYDEGFPEPGRTVYTNLSFKF